MHLICLSTFSRLRRDASCSSFESILPSAAWSSRFRVSLVSFLSCFLSRSLSPGIVSSYRKLYLLRKTLSS